MGSEAGRHRPPLQPRETISRKSVLPPRVIESSEALSSPLGYAALLTATQTELDGAFLRLPQRTPFQEAASHRVIVAIGSDNSIKTNAMKDLLKPHHAVVVRVGEAEEAHTLETVYDATSKAVDAAAHIDKGLSFQRRVIRTRPYVTLATDVLNAVPVVENIPETNEQRLTFRRLGKPGTLVDMDPIESVQTTFQRLATLAETYDWQRIPYITEIATVIHNPRGPENDAVSLQRSAIFLTRAGIVKLATKEGFEEYQQRLEAKGFDIKKIAGGFELDILDELGMVDYFTGTKADIVSADFASQRDAAKDHAYRIALGHADERLIAAYFGTKENQEAISQESQSDMGNPIQSFAAH